MLHLTRTILVIVISLVLCAYVGYGSYDTHSFGVISDGLHALGDVSPFVLQTWGILAGLSLYGLAAVDLKIRTFNFYYLAVVALSLFVAGVYRLFVPKEIEPNMLHFALVGFGASFVQYFLGHGFERSQMLHLAVDVLSSAGVVLASVFVLYSYPVADSIITIVIALVTAWAARQCRLGKTHNHVHGECGRAHSHTHHH